ncbi:MAG TPA: hypothetical protein VN578_21145 [Candidatus Binatia bacterium]|jgi:hypothetical protein|nr:hypothetical protein [Candidatus Binatia bacterium]
MKARIQHFGRQVGALGAGLIFLILVLVTGRSIWGQSSPPGLGIVLTASNQITLTVTNASTNVLYYEIWWSEFMDANAMVLTNGSWLPFLTGTNGQTNFVVGLGDFETGFFRAIKANAFDNDGIPSYEDARPFAPTSGVLTVTIESPANGSNVQ